MHPFRITCDEPLVRFFAPTQYEPRPQHNKLKFGNSPPRRGNMQAVCQSAGQANPAALSRHYTPLPCVPQKNAPIPHQTGWFVFKIRHHLGLFGGGYLVKFLLWQDKSASRGVFKNGHGGYILLRGSNLQKLSKWKDLQLQRVIGNYGGVLEISAGGQPGRSHPNKKSQWVKSCELGVALL